MTLLCATRLIHLWDYSFTRDMAHLHVTWLIYTWHDWFTRDTTHSNVARFIHSWHDWFARDMTNLHLTWCICMRHDSLTFDMTHLHSWYHSDPQLNQTVSDYTKILQVTWLIFTCIMTHSCACRAHGSVYCDAFTCVMHSYVWHDLGTCEAWPIHIISTRMLHASLSLSLLLSLPLSLSLSLSLSFFLFLSLVCSFTRSRACARARALALSLSVSLSVSLSIVATHTQTYEWLIHMSDMTHSFRSWRDMKYLPLLPLFI